MVTHAERPRFLGLALDKIPMPGHLFEDNPFDEGTTRRGTDTPGYRPEKPAGIPVPGILQARTLEWVAISFSVA